MVGTTGGFVGTCWTLWWQSWYSDTPLPLTQVSLVGSSSWLLLLVALAVSPSCSCLLSLLSWVSLSPVGCLGCHLPVPLGCSLVKYQGKSTSCTRTEGWVLMFLLPALPHCHIPFSQSSPSSGSPDPLSSLGLAQICGFGAKSYRKVLPL